MSARTTGFEETLLPARASVDDPAGAPSPSAETDPTESLVAPGTQLGAYRVEGLLGQGAVGAVYAAVSAQGARVALKVLKRAHADDPVHVARMEREAAALRALSHPHVVPILDAGRMPDGRAFLSMPRIEGASLDEVLRARGRPFEPASAWALLRGVALALDAAHALGITHRDVKPSNIFVENSPAKAHREDEPGHARLLDFGVAKFSEKPAGMTLTSTGAMVGTPAYMAPEQWWGEPAGPAADQYALGATLFELLAGSPPFRASSLAELLQAHLYEPAPTLASRGAHATEAQETVLARALAKEPAARFGSMRALVEAADLAFGAPADRSALVRERRSQRALAVVAALAFGPLALVLEGYGGSRSPLLWLREMGGPGYGLALLCLVSLACVALGSARACAVCALVFACVGTFVESAGISATGDNSPRFSEVDLFPIYALGFTESGTGRFVGLGLAAAMALAALVLASDARRATEQRWARASRALSGFFALVAAVAALAHTPRAALFALYCAALSALAVGAPSARARELARALTGSLVLVASAVSIASQLQATVSIAWSHEGGRPARVRVLLDAWRESQRTWGAIFLCASLLAALWFARARAAPGELRALRVTPVRAAAALVVALWAAAHGYNLARMRAVLDRLYAELSPQFSLFARLDPPTQGRAPVPSLSPPLAPPVRAPAVRIARDVVAIDDARVALTRALATPEGSTALALDLSHRLAREPEVLDRSVQLSVTADRTVPAALVGRVLTVAYGLGVRRVEFVLAPSEALVYVPLRAPPEVYYVLPRDFVALPATLEPSRSPAFSHAVRTYAEALAPLLAQPRSATQRAVTVGVLRDEPPVR